MSNAIQNSHSAPAHKAGRSFTRFVRASVKPVVFKLSRKLSVTYWPGRRRSISAVLLALLSGFVPGLAGAAPTGGQVVAGSAVVLKPTSSTTQVNQSSQNAIINWQSFSIGTGEAVRFVQPSASAVALNRVIGSDPSLIFGSLTANGKVFLVNSAGVYFAPGASVDVGGLVASSMNISNSSFMSGKYKFEAGANAGAVANDGQLRGAFVVLAAPKVSNGGSIVTTGGTTALAAGGRVSLDIAGDKLVSMSVDAATANAAVSNSGSISADGGKVFMTASSANAVLDTVINTSGIVRAGSIAERNGQIVIDGGAAGTVQVSGTLAASGAGAGTAGGAVQVLGQRIALQGGANIDVSGDTGGGSALVGGDLHGAGGVKTAAFTEVSQGAVINADALASGDGGKVVVWADQHTGFRGDISAKGGAAGGDGGFVETSGKKTLAFAGKVNTTAAHGVTGTLLLDPTDITISNRPSSTGTTESGGIFTDPNAAVSNLAVSDLTTALSSSNVIVDTTSGFGSPGHISVFDAVTWNNVNSLTLKANGGITVLAPIVNNGSGGINLYGDGAIFAGSLTSNGGAIEIKGNGGGASLAGSVTGGAIVSGGGNVVVQSLRALTTGSIDAGTGTIAVIGNSGVAINGALATTNSGSSAIVVNAGVTGVAGNGAGGDVTLTAGGSLAVGAGGHATLYTGTIAGSVGVTEAAGAGSGNFRYNSDATTSNFSAALGTGVNVVYREQPTLTIGATGGGIIYGDTTPVFTPTYSGLQNGDTSAQALSTGPTLSFAAPLSSSGRVVAGAHSVSPSGAADQLGYNVAYADGTLTVAKKALLASGSTAADKVYDGTVAATVDTSATAIGSGGTTSGDGLVYVGDTVSLDTSTATGSFIDKNAGVGKPVIIYGLTLQGNDAANYMASGSANATIAPKALTATAAAPNKVYDGTTTAAPTLTITAGLVGAETVGASATGNFNSKDVLTANTVTVQTTTLADGENGGLAANYTLGTGQTASARITRKPLTANVLFAPDKTYDGNAAAIALMGIDPAGLVGNEQMIAFGVGAFNTKDVLTANMVTVQLVLLAGGPNGGMASNYSAVAGQTSVAHIMPRALTATVVSAADKSYDGNRSATASMAIVPSGPFLGIFPTGLVGTETVSASGTGLFNTKDVLTANKVTVDKVTLADGTNGGLGSNYYAAAGQTAVAHITPKALTASIVAADKIYDGTRDASATMSIDPAGLVGTETVTVSGTGLFNTKDVLTANLVTVDRLALADGANGGMASNYSAAAGQSAVAHITPKALTASMVSASNKVYDGSDSATVSMSIAPAGLVGTETVTAAGIATFNTKDVLTAEVVTVNSVVLADGAHGGLASNYSAIAGQTGAANITPKALSVSAAAADKTYDGNRGATVAMSIDPAGLVGTETVSVSGTGLFNTKDVLSANLVTVDTVRLADGANGGLASNYSAGAGQTSVARITPKALLADANAFDKVYDGNAVADLTLAIGSGLVGAETVGVSGTASFNSKDVLEANLVTINSVVLADGAAGGLASNYSLGTGQAMTAHIATKALTATASAPHKVYDGNAVAAPVLSISGGLVGAETVGVSGAATFNSKDVLAANLVTVNSVALANGANGGLASNYSLAAGQTAAARITPKALTATVAPTTKVYDGNTSASTVMDIQSGLVGTEKVTVSSTGTFNSKNVSTANQVTVNSVQLANGANGGVASNYSLGAGQKVAGNITVRPYVSWTGAASGNWSDAANWEAGAIPDLDNVANVIIPAGKSVIFNSSVPALNGAVRVAGIDGAGDLTISNGALAVSNALKIGSFAQAAGQVNAASFKANRAFSQTGGALAVTGLAEIVQASGAVSLGNIAASGLSISGGASVTQLANSVLAVSDTLTLAAGSGDVNLSNQNNDFNKVVIDSAHNVSLNDLNAISLAGNVTGNLAAGAHGLIGQSASLNVEGTSLFETTGTIKLDDKPNALKGRARFTSGGDTLLASAGGLTIGGDIGGKLVLSASGPVLQGGDALHVTGTTNIDAGPNAVSLSAAGNHFAGPLSVKGGAVSLVDSGALILGASTAGTLSVKSGGAVTQTGALTVFGDSVVSAPGQAITLDNAGNDFGASLALTGANVTVADKNSLRLGPSKISGTFKASAKGDITQKGALVVAGTTTFDTTGALVLTDAANDFGGAVAATASSVVLVDQNALTVSKITASRADLTAGTELQTTPGGLVDAAEVTLSLKDTAVNGAIGSLENSFTVKNGAQLTLGPTTPAVPAYLDGKGVLLVLANPVARMAYMTEVQPALFLGGRKVFNDVAGGAIAANTGGFSQIIESSRNEADNNAELIDRGLGTDLTAPIPYPHAGLMRALAPGCGGGLSPQECYTGAGNDLTSPVRFGQVGAIRVRKPDCVDAKKREDCD